eukprot:Phypoly_transcript_04634.p1 GENE.Phypoly_transcript_04634~~Phypoly_transcript_04634.p1  ORF type:complete len:668 (+),score=63.37 Phypoly_transcript_04634:93-2096(+)
MPTGWNLLLLVSVFLAISTCARVPKVTNTIKEELLQEHEKHDFHPSFGLKQLQHAATLMHSLWHNGENIYATNDQPIERYVAEAQTPRNEEREHLVYNYKGLSKRGDVPEDQQLCTFGAPQYNITEQNTCFGAVCTVQEAVCTNNDTTTYTIYPNATGFRSYPWSQCEVTKMLCFESGRAESINMKERYGVTNCSLVTDQIVCWDVQPFGNRCVVEVICSNYTNWGSYAWGLPCSTDRLYCNGTLVLESRLANYQDQIADGQCHIETIACSEQRNIRTCYKKNMTCGFQEDLGNYTGNCNLQRMDVPCAVANATNSNCTIAQIICNETVFDASVAHANQSQCYVYSLNCNEKIIVLPLSSCKADTIDCNGNRTKFATYNGTLSLCSVSHVKCNQISGVGSNATTNCSSLQFACPESPKCSLTRLPCSVTCEQMLNTSSCVCPDDFSGRFCDTRAEYECSASLVHPPVSCLPPPTADPKDYLLSGDRKCTVFDDYEQNATLGYYLDCAFMNLSYVNSSSADYPYWAKNNKISISKEVAWALRYKIFNFNQLFDAGATLITGNLTASQILGQELVWFNFSLQDIPDRFWFARRLYYELHFNPGPSGNITFWRNFVDAPTRPIPTKIMSTITTTTLVLIFGGIAVFLGFVGYVGYKCFRVRQDAAQKQNY